MTEQLRMDATVGDKFTTPLRQLRDRIKDVHTGSIDSIRRVQDSFSGITSTATSAGNAVRNSLGPALQALGVSTLTLSGALAAVAASVKGFSSSTASLAMLGREVGLTADRLRTFEAFGQRFGLSADQMRNASRSVASNMYDFRKGVGDTWQWLRTVEPEFAKTLRGMTNDQAVSHIVGFLNRIQDPIARARAAQRLLGDESLGVLGSGILGPASKVWDDVVKNLGRLPASAEKSALQAQASFSRLSESVQALRDQIGVELAPSLSKATEGLAAWVRANGSGISKSISEATTWFTSQNWGEISTKAISVATSFKDAAVAIASAASAIAKLFGGSEPKIVSLEKLQQYLVPRGEALRRQIEKLRAERNVLALEGEGDRPGSARALARRDGLDALDAQIKRLEEDMAKAVDKGVDRGSKDGAKKLEENTKGALERLRTWFRASYDGGALGRSGDGGNGFGGLIQRASLGGASARSIAFGSPGARGGSLFASGGGGRVPGGGSAGGAAMTGGNVAAAYKALREEGMSHAQASALLGTFQQESGFNSQAWNAGEGAGGLMQWRADRQRRLRDFAASRGEQGMGSVETQARFAAQEAQGKHGERRAGAFLGSQTADEASRNLQPFVRWGHTGGRHAFASRFGAMSEEALRSGGAAPRAGGKPGEGGAPLVEGGRYTSAFGMRQHPLSGRMRMHAGVDLAAPAGSAARARQDGTVTGVNGHGDVTVKYSDGSTGTYRHINAGVEQGQKVSAGETLGTLRRHDRRSTGPHLHYETRDAEGRLVNPRAAMDAGIVRARESAAGFADTMRTLNERGRAFAMPAAGLAQPNAALQDAAHANAGGGVTTIQGGANLNIKLDGFPSSTRTMTSVDGLFKNVDIDRGRQMATGPS